MLHKCGYGHCDIKSDNVKASMQPDGTDMHAVVCDLGSCQALGTCELHLTWQFEYALSLVDKHAKTHMHSSAPNKLSFANVRSGKLFH